jgi:SAM-dependent methyltransferase
LEERTIGGLHDFLLSSILPRYAMRKGRAVDLGAGSGALAVRLRAFGFAVLAVDTNTERFRADVPFARLDLNQVDFASALGEARFDFVSAVEVIEHVENPIGFLRNVSRLLQPDGVAVITTPNVDSAPARVKFLLRGKLRFLGDACDDTHISPIFWDLLTRQCLPRAELQLVGHHLYPPNGYKVNLPRSAWAFRILARFLSGPALLGDSHVFVLKRRKTAREGGDDGNAAHH